MLESVKSRDELYKISRNGQDIMNQIEQSLKPIVAAIAGSCLGGGLEVSFVFLFVIDLFLLSGCFSMSLSYCIE